MDDSVAQALSVIDNIIRSVEQQTKMIANINGLSLRQLQFLNEIHFYNNNNISKLMKYLDMTQYKVTGIVEHLLSKKLVYRNQGPNDKRVGILSLTDEGIEILNNVSAMRKNFSEKFKSLPDSQQAQILIALEQFHNLCSN